MAGPAAEATKKSQLLSVGLETRAALLDHEVEGGWKWLPQTAPDGFFF